MGRANEVWPPECFGRGRNHNTSVMLRDCISYFGVCTFAPVDGLTDSQKSIDILRKNLWPAVSECFGGKVWFFQGNNLVNWCLLTGQWKTEK